MLNQMDKLERIESRQEGINHASVTYDMIDPTKTIELVKSPKAGAISTFLGTTRDNFEDKVVVKLEYEAYVDMALNAMLSICNKAREKYELINIAIQHKLGDCPILDVSVIIAASSAHRAESLNAVHFAIDELKATVPIWKKECYAEGDAKWKANKEAEKS